MRFCEASAKDNFNVDEIFLKLVDDILGKVGISLCLYSCHCAQTSLIRIFHIKSNEWTNVVKLQVFQLQLV